MAARHHTDLADINEIMLGYYLNGEKWFDAEAKRQYQDKIKKVPPEEASAQIEKAKVMAKEVLKWAKSKRYSTVKKIYWTARPGVLQQAVDPKGELNILSKKNPTDILIQFSRGPANGFLGVSAKSTKGKTDIGFKNPGVGTVEKSLHIKLMEIVDKKVDYVVENFGLSKNNTKRKQEIRANKKIQEKTIELGQKALSEIRDRLHDRLKKMPNQALRNYVMKAWMDAGEVYPPYIKVTGKGNKAPFTADIEDPLKSEKLSAINSNDLKVSKVGNDSVGISAGPKRIMKMRAKFESEKLASSVKFSGDPW